MNFRQSIRTLYIPALILFVLSVVLVQLPLFNYLGYEFSTVIALSIPLIFGFVTIREMRRQFRAVEKFETIHFYKAIAYCIYRCLLVLFIPFAVSTAAMVFVKNCSYGEGVEFFLLIPVVTTVWTVAIAGSCALLFRRAGLIYALILAIVLLYPLYLGYALPQIYSYNFIYGFFPGFSYDEVLTISSTLVLFRCVTLIVALCSISIAAFIIVQRNSQSKKILRLSTSSFSSQREFLLVLATCFMLIPAWVFRDTLGFESPVSAIRQTLNARYTTEHFQIYYSHSSFSEKEIQFVGAMHEFRFHQVTSSLMVNFQGRISSYIYPDADTKRRFIGAGNTDIAKPWRREIHLNKETWDAVVKHELVHVVAGEFGMPLIKAHYHIGLVEGLAMAIDQDFGNRTLAEYAQAMMKFGIVKDPATLITPIGFATQSSSVSYVMMGSFCKFLIDRFGIVHFKELYGGLSPEHIYGMSYNGLTLEWRQYLQTINVPDDWRQHVEFYFRRPSIFAKECARAIALVNENGARALQRNNPVGAMQLFHQGLTMSWNTESYRGLVRSAFGAARYDSVISLVDAQMQDSLRRAGIVSLFLLYGDALWYRSDYITAQHVYERILSLDLSPGFNEAAALRLALLSIPELHSRLIEFFTGNYRDPANASAAQHWLDSVFQRTPHPLISYLRASVEFNRQNYSGSIRHLESIRDTLFSFSILNARKEERLGESYFMNKQYQDARTHFWQSLNFDSSAAAHNRVDDELQQCEWFERHAGKYLTH